MICRISNPCATNLHVCIYIYVLYVHIRICTCVSVALNLLIGELLEVIKSHVQLINCLIRGNVSVYMYIIVNKQNHTGLVLKDLTV
jgi:hypothetical protein